MIPGFVTLIPQFVMFKNFGWLDSFAPLIVPQLFANPAYLFLMRQFFLTLGRTAVALANWTEEERMVRLQVPPERDRPQRYHLQHDTLETVELAPTATLPLVLSPLSVALVVCGTA
jgi:hypothetical protein